MPEPAARTRIRLIGPVVEVKSNEPLALTDPRSVYVVEAGELIVFGVEMSTGEAGQRRFLLSAGPGEAVCGVPRTAEIEMVGTGNVGTEVRKMPLSTFLAQGDEAASILTAWARKLVAGVEYYDPALKNTVIEAGGRAGDISANAASDPAAFAAASLARLRALLDAVDAGDDARLLATLAREEQVENDAIKSLAQVLSESEDAVVMTSEDPLVEACRTVAENAGIDIVEPETELPSDLRPALRVIAKASQMRVRRVFLEPGWWSLDAGPMLATLKDDHAPVALVPAGAGGYELVDHNRGERHEVDAEEAERITSEAFVFYPSWPAVPLQLQHLLNVGLRGTSRDLVRIALFGLGSALLAPLTPIATAQLFNEIIPSAQRGRLLVIVIALLLGAVAGAAFQIAQGVALVRLQTRLNASLGAALWDRILRLPVPFFRGYSIGDLAGRTLAVDAIRQILAQSGFAIALSAAFSLTSLAMLFVLDLTLALISSALLAVYVVITFRVTARQLRRLRELVDLQGEVSGLVVQQLAAVPKLRVTATERRAFAEWSKLFARQQTVAYESGKLRNVQIVLNATWPPLSMLVVFWWMSRLGPGGLDPGTFLAFFAALGQVLVAVRSITSSLGNMLQAIPLYESAKPILEAVPEVQPAAQNPGPLSGLIEINHVDFRYSPEGPLVLNDVSIEIEPGQFVALVGPSGAGKSSILRLLLGFERPEAGSVLVDGKDIDTLDIELVRRQIGVVLQSAQVMPGSILTNIIGKVGLTRDDAWRAATQAGLDEDLRNMPMGINTLISEGSSTLSGGQKQRILIARALAGNPRLLLFDEATSALDNVTQKTVTETLSQLGITRIVIAHRLSTIVGADKIVVMERGRVVETGTYEELMSAGGPFAELAARQIA